jgi:catechol 2,3-dioxygenase-like lactoylglutathione lyase family enzyme
MGKEEDDMFADRQATAMIPVSDLARAKTWYADKLGLKPSKEWGDMGAEYELKGVHAYMYPTQYAGTAQHTILSFNSPDLMSDMKALRDKGIVFLEYDQPGFKTTDGVADFGEAGKNAWCKDSEGNILGFVQGMGA